jgi:hypothetical protein
LPNNIGFLGDQVMFVKHPQMPVFYFKDLSSFFVFSKAISDEWGDIWYRGHSDGSYLLEPRIIRSVANLEIEQSLSREFVRRAVSFFPDIPQDNYARWLFIMQHYGIPTRLLDWTESLPIALYFAFHSRSVHPPCVWFLNPIMLNSWAIGEDAIPSEYALESQQFCERAFSLDDEIMSNISDLPIGVIPHYFDVRLAAQRACFTIHGVKPLPLDFLLYKSRPAKIQNVLVKAQFEEQLLDQIRQEVAHIIPSSSQIFPDITGLVQELVAKL